MDNDVNATQIKLGTPGGCMQQGDKSKKIVSNLTPRSLGKYCRSFIIINFKKLILEREEGEWEKDRERDIVASACALTKD